MTRWWSTRSRYRDWLAQSAWPGCAPPRCPAGRLMHYALWHGITARCLPFRTQNGVEGLIIGGTTGEGQLMSWDEHIMLIAHTGARTLCGAVLRGCRPCSLLLHLLSRAIPPCI